MHGLDAFISPWRAFFEQKGKNSLLWSLLLTLFLMGCTASLPTSSALSGHILIVGSTALQPLETASAALFEQQHPQVHIDIQGGGSSAGLDAVTQKQADIGSSDIYANRAIYPDPNLTDHIICISIFAMVINPGVHIQSLTRQQLIGIFSTGTLRNWKQVGGPNLAIVPVVRSLSSGTRANFREYVLGGQDESSNSTGTLIQEDSSLAVREKVAKTPGAIGYLALSAVDSSIRQIAIDGITATLAHIEQGSYSFWSYEHLYTLDDTNPLLNAYLDFLLTPSIQALAGHLKFIPLSALKLSQRETTLGTAQVSTGSFFFLM